MKQAILIVGVAALLVAAPAFAQEALAPRGFVPIELSQQKAQALTNALGEIPLKYSLPIYNFINREEDQAIIGERQKEAKAAREAEAAKKGAEKRATTPRLLYTPRPRSAVAPMLAHPPAPPPLPAVP